MIQQMTQLACIAKQLAQRRHLATSALLPAHHSFYIDGAWVAPADRVVKHHVINPATEKPIATIALGSSADVDAAVGAAQRAFPAWSETSKEERLHYLERLAELYSARQAEMGAAISQEMGAPVSLARGAQTAAGLGHLRHFVRVLREFAFEEPLRPDSPADRLAHVPIGVAALIAPWNWPMNQVCLKAAPALAAGCTCVLKPSEVAPLSSLLFAEMVRPPCISAHLATSPPALRCVSAASPRHPRPQVHDAGFPPGAFNLVNGEGATVGEALASHPHVDMV